MRVTSSGTGGIGNYYPISNKAPRESALSSADRARQEQTGIQDGNEPVGVAPRSRFQPEGSQSPRSLLDGVPQTLTLSESVAAQAARGPIVHPNGSTFRDEQTVRTLFRNGPRGPAVEDVIGDSRMVAAYMALFHSYFLILREQLNLPEKEERRVGGATGGSLGGGPFHPGSGGSQSGQQQQQQQQDKDVPGMATLPNGDKVRRFGDVILPIDIATALTDPARGTAASILARADQRFADEREIREHIMISRLAAF